MKILVTGSDGYIGSLLTALLAHGGHEVVGLDTGYYRDGWLYNDTRGFDRLLPTINKDLRLVSAEDVSGMDAVAHLAELSNDPLGQNNPDNTYSINHQGSLQLAQVCKAAGVPRFVYTSSCSVYGVGLQETVDESSPVNPQTAYAKCKVLVEHDVGELADQDFCPVFLRNATAYGPSPRMRFDIVLNNLCGLAWAYQSIAMVSDGTPWRPLVHVLDICRAIECALQAPREAVHNQIFNVGQNSENYRVREIAEVVGKEFPGCKVTLGKSGGDNRSYRVNFDKIHAGLPGFACANTIVDGARQLHHIFEHVSMSAERFEFRAFTRLKQLEFLIGTQQLDERFFWRAL